MQEAAWLKRLGPALRPKVIIVGVYRGSDLRANALPASAKLNLYAPPRQRPTGDGRARTSQPAIVPAVEGTCQCRLLDVTGKSG